MTQVKCKQTNEVFSVKVSINTELDECNTNKPFKFKIKKRLEAIDKELKKSKEEI